MTNSDMLLTLLNAALEEDKLLRDELEESKAEAANERVGSAYLQECAMIERDALSKMLESTVKALDESLASNLEDVLAARVAQLEGEAEGARIALGLLGAALLPTKENAASFAKALEWDGSSGGPCTQDAVDILRAIRARAGLDGKEGNRG